jgi:hypothetical protein
MRVHANSSQSDGLARYLPHTKFESGKPDPKQHISRSEERRCNSNAFPADIPRKSFTTLPRKVGLLRHSRVLPNICPPINSSSRHCFVSSSLHSGIQSQNNSTITPVKSSALPSPLERLSKPSILYTALILPQHQPCLHQMQPTMATNFGCTTRPYLLE